LKHYELIAWDQNINAKLKIYLNVIFPFQEVFPFEKFFLIGLLETSYAGKSVFRLLTLPT
jgi:hypothetical protein